MIADEPEAAHTHTEASMMKLDVSQITSWHAHVYFAADTRDAALAVRDVVAAHFGDRIALGRFHERPVGPHPCWSYQIAFSRRSSPTSSDGSR